jgi:hypothetical protein
VLAELPVGMGQQCVSVRTELPWLVVDIFAAVISATQYNTLLSFAII